MENSGRSQWIKQEDGQSFDACLAKVIFGKAGTKI